MKKKVCLARIFLSTVHIANTTELKMILCSAKKSKQVKDGKCRSFKYDPLLRMPNVTVFKTDFFRQRILNFNPLYFYYTGMNFVNIPFQN